MTASLRRACDDVGAPVGLVLEGGYDLGALAGSMAALMPVLARATTPAAGRASPCTRWPSDALARRRAEPTGGGTIRRDVGAAGVVVGRRRARRSASACAGRTGR